MLKKKLITLRIEPELLEKIDRYAESKTYLSRSSVICNILDNVFSCSNAGTLYRLVETWFAYDKGFVIDFRKDDETLRKRAEENKTL